VVAADAMLVVLDAVILVAAVADIVVVMTGPVQGRVATGFVGGSRGRMMLLGLMIWGRMRVGMGRIAAAVLDTAVDLKPVSGFEGMLSLVFGCRRY
jgi:hypothetical protein